MEYTALPSNLRALLSQHEWKQDDLGCSSAEVFRLAEGGRTRFFLKGEIAGPFAELPLEAERLLWLGEQKLQCPSVVALESHEGRNWLLLSALRGSDLASSKLTTDRQRIEILAAALRRLHELDPETCPFDHRLTARLRLAKARMEAGAVDESDFDEERQNATAASLFAYLEANQPDVTDPVVAHGDACLPNFMTHMSIAAVWALRIDTRILRWHCEASDTMSGKRGFGISSIVMGFPASATRKSPTIWCWTSSINLRKSCLTTKPAQRSSL